MYPRSSTPFDVDDRVHIKVDFDLAMRVAEVLLQSGSVDKQLLALGHNLKNLDEDSVHRPRREPQPEPEGQRSYLSNPSDSYRERSYTQDHFHNSDRQDRA